MKVFLAVGSEELEEIIRECGVEVIDSEDNLVSLLELLEFINVDSVIINRLLDNEEGEILIKIAKRAARFNIKLVILTDDFEKYEERKLITNLVNLGVNGYIKLSEVSKESVQEVLFNYPKEFDFSIFSKPKVEVVEKVKSVFKEVITVYSPLSQGSSTIAAHIAVKLAKSKNCRVCIVDFNPLKPRLKYIFDTDFEYTLADALDAVVRKSLTYNSLEGFTKTSKYQRNLDLLPGIYDMNEYYMSKSEQYIEIIEKLKFIYDYVIIDTHSWYDVLTTDAALKMADKVLVPLKGNEYDIEGVNRLIDMFSKYNDYETNRFYGVINFYSGKNLTFIEIESKLKLKVAGYISKDISFEDINAFNNKKIMNEFSDILKSIGFESNKEKSIKDFFKIKMKKVR